MIGWRQVYTAVPTAFGFATLVAITVTVPARRVLPELRRRPLAEIVPRPAGLRTRSLPVRLPESARELELLFQTQKERSPALLQGSWPAAISMASMIGQF